RAPRRPSAAGGPARGRRRPLRKPGPGVRGPRVSEQDRARPEQRGRRAGAARTDPLLLRLLRLALRGARALAPRAPGPHVPRRPLRGRRAVWARAFPDAPFAAPARAALSRSLTPANLAGEVAYVQGKGRTSFERP